MSLAEIEADIRTAFDFHREQRRGLPVFGLEHGLDAERVQEAQNALGRMVRSRAVESIFQAFPLSVVACSSEVGYDYRGTGTDFWPKLEAEIAAEITESGRQAHTRAFLYAHKTFGLKAPPETPWTRNFRHIAWPITNAVASREIHRPLALALRRSMTFALGGASILELVERLKIEARSQQNTRLIEWLQHTDVVSALVSRLLDLPVEENAVETVSLDRIVADLEADPIARRSVASASEKLKTANRKPAVQPFRFRVVPDVGSFPRVTLQVPIMEGPEREAIERELAKFGGRISLADGGCELVSSQLSPGSELEVQISSLHSLLSGSKDLLSGVNESEELVDRLRKLMPSVSDPMVLVEEMVPGHFGDWNSKRKIPRGRRVLLATSRIIAEPEGLVCLAESEGVHFLEIQLSSAKGLLHLNRAGAAMEHEQPYEIMGGIAIAEGIAGPVYARGMPVLLRRTGVGGSGEWIVRSNAVGQLRLGANHVAATLDDAPDHQEIQIETGEANATTIVSFTSVDETARPLSVQLEPSSPSVEDIQRGQLRLQISSPMDLKHVFVSITVESSGVRLASASTKIDTIPATIGSGSELIRELAKALVRAAPDRVGHLNLEVSLHKIWKRRWRLDWDPVEVNWLNNDGVWHALSDDSELEISRSEAAAPLSRAAYDDPDSQSSTYRVLIPTADGTPVYLGAICDGPEALRPGDIDPQLPGKIARTLESGEDIVSFPEAVNGYLLWSVARPVHPIASLASRAVAGRIEELIVEQLCGSAWLEAERRSQISAGSLFDVVAARAIETELAAGGELPPVPTSLQKLLARSLADEMQSAWPQLSADLLDIDFDKFAEEMDGAVANTYGVLADHLEGEEAEAFRDVDPYSEPSQWQSALRSAVDRMSGSLLSRMILPAERGDQLQTWDFSLPEAQLVSLLADIHTDRSPRGQKQWITAPNIQDCLHLWTEPSEVLRSEEWLTSLARFLQDRQTARAVRYAALRYRAARSMDARHG
ncbi:hypothetical protein [Sphingopyxis sp. P8]|uniref:hypothetical protein n=1 Tax=Sphingopyxis sp. P8 TaxID=2763256 RepID=UPI001D0A3103|nr:hypothetical protein [Sphingopyxis sp. P8]